MLVYTPWNSFDVWLHHSTYDNTYDMMKSLTNKIMIEISTFSHKSNVSSDET